MCSGKTIQFGITCVIGGFAKLVPMGYNKEIFKFDLKKNNGQVEKIFFLIDIRFFLWMVVYQMKDPPLTKIISSNVDQYDMWEISSKEGKNDLLRTW